jgi:hypothetical protein
MLRLSESNRRQHFGKFPSVSINDDGIIVEVYQPFIVSSEIHYKVGRLSGEEMKMSEETRRLDYGRYPKVAINNRNRVIEVHEGTVYRKICYNVGEIDNVRNKITWYPRVYTLCRGKYPAVAVHGDRVVITYDRAYGSYTSYYSMGNFTTDGNGIQWEPENAKNHKLMAATETSVAMNERNIVVAGRAWSGILCRLGRFCGNAIEFTKEFPFNHLGYCPTVCLNDDGAVLMVWQSTPRKLKYVATNIPDPENPSITWPKHDPTQSYKYDSGYNPTVAISPVGGHVIEEHDPNYALYRCRLSYRIGVLEKLRPQQEQVLERKQEQEEQQPPPIQPPKLEKESATLKPHGSTNNTNGTRDTKNTRVTNNTVDTTGIDTNTIQ